MHISKAREEIALPIHLRKNKFKDTSIIYLLTKAKNRFSLSKIKLRRKWRSKTKKIKHSSSKLKEAFSVYDKNGDGMVNPTDLGVMIRALGGNPTEAQVNDIVTKEKLNGPFDYDRFVDLMRKHLRARPKNEDGLRKAFDVIDDDGHGYVDVSQLRQMLTTRGESLDPQEFDEWIQSLGVTNDGNVCYEEIIAPMVASRS